MSPFSGREAITEFLQDVDDQLDQSVEVYLVGGSAMTAHQLKDQTKDIDLVLGVSAEFELVRDALLDMGFVVENEPTAEFEDIGRTLELSGKTGVQVDLFEEQIVGKLRLSTEMRERAKRIYEGESVSGFTLSKEDMFLLKGVAGRGYDPEDMLALVRSGLQFSVVGEELEAQLPVNTGTVEAHQLNSYSHPLMTFEQTITRFDGLPSGFTDRVEALADRAFTEHAVIEHLQTDSLEIEVLCREVTDNDDSIDRPETAREAVTNLAEKGIVEQDGADVSLAEKISLP